MDNDLFTADILGAIVKFAIFFSICWGIFYTTFGSWLKVRLIHLKLAPSPELLRRYRPVIVSHIISCLIFVNPCAVFYIYYIDLMLMLWFFNIIPGRGCYLALTLILLYFWLTSVATDCLVLRLLPKWHRMNWLKYKPPLKRLLLANLAANLASLGAIFGFILVVSGVVFLIEKW
jgi:hypothetical protein